MHVEQQNSRADFSSHQARSRWNQALVADAQQTRWELLQTLANDQALPDALTEELSIARTLFSDSVSKRHKQLYALEDLRRVEVALRFKHLPGDLHYSAIQAFRACAKSIVELKFDDFEELANAIVSDAEWRRKHLALLNTHVQSVVNWWAELESQLAGSILRPWADSVRRCAAHYKFPTANWDTKLNQFGDVSACDREAFKRAHLMACSFCGLQSGKLTSGADVSPWLVAMTKKMVEWRKKAQGEAAERAAKKAKVDQEQKEAAERAAKKAKVDEEQKGVEGGDPNSPATVDLPTGASTPKAVSGAEDVPGAGTTPQAPEVSPGAAVEDATPARESDEAQAALSAEAKERLAEEVAEGAARDPAPEAPGGAAPEVAPSAAEEAALPPGETEEAQAAKGAAGQQALPGPPTATKSRGAPPAEGIAGAPSTELVVAAPAGPPPKAPPKAEPAAAEQAAEESAQAASAPSKQAAFVNSVDTPLTNGVDS